MPDIELPDAEDLKPRVRSAVSAAPNIPAGLLRREDLPRRSLDPLAQEFGADLYLPSGEITDTLLATMAKTGAADGREMIVFVFADCDPAGYQMAVSIGHKLRAFKEAFHPSLNFQVHAPALTVEQVGARAAFDSAQGDRERAAGWRERYGVEQTEIDALATLRPELLREISRK